MKNFKEETKTGWGGARKGAGRKKSGTKYYGFLATREVDDILSRVEGSKSAFINQCILECGQNKNTPTSHDVEVHQ